MLTNRISQSALIMVGSIALILAASPGRGQGPDVPARPAAVAGTLEFENDAIAVLRIRMAPHERTAMHDIPSARLVIWLTDTHLKDTGPDGTVTEYTRPAGSIDWITPRRHMGENLSDRELDFLAVIPKARAASGSHGH